MATKSEEIMNPNGCLNRAAPDEPIFVLRAHDPLAAGIVDEWATRYADKVDGPMDARRAAKYDEARHLAARMRTWALQNLKS